MRPARPRRTLVSAAILAGLLATGATVGSFAWLRTPQSPAAIPVADATTLAIGLATEADLRTESPAARTLIRFAPNPAILVLDFPTLGEQGRMLNRMAAWAEKAGVPHDRLLTDGELAAAIQASGTTPDTYYYGHDYRAADLIRFFALADSEHIDLGAEERQLRRILAQAGAEPFGVGALITLPRADTANGVSATDRAVILHHELSHGEYFTNAAYTRYVQTIWASVLTEAERARFRSYLAEDGYDPSLEDLMINEMQAYLMYTPDARFFDPAKLGIPPARLAQIRQSFAAGMPSCWLRDETSATPTLPELPLAPGAAPTLPLRAPRWRGTAQGPARVSRTRAAVAALPPRRRKASTAV